MLNSKKRIRRLVTLDEKTDLLKDTICKEEGISFSEFIKLCVRAWRTLSVYDKKFPTLTAWLKAKVVTTFVEKENEDKRFMR